MSIRRNYKSFYIFIFIIWYSTEILFSTTIQSLWGMPIDKANDFVGKVIFLLVLLQIILGQTYKKKEIVLIILITIPIIISTQLSGYNTILSAWMFIVAAKGIKLDKVIKATYIVQIIMISIVFFLCILGMIPDCIMMRNGVIRHSMGFNHPNMLGLRLFQMTVCHCYLRRKKYNLGDYLLILIIDILVYFVPNSQSTFLCILFLFFLVLFYEKNRNIRNGTLECIGKFLVRGAALINLISIIFSFIDIASIPLLQQVDKWMSIRFSSCHRVLKIYGITLFGHRIYVSEGERNSVGIQYSLWLDNAYMGLLLRFGIIIFLIFSISYLYLMYYLNNKKRYMEVIILFVFSLYGVMENGLYNISHNLFLIEFSYILYLKHEEEFSVDKLYKSNLKSIY